MYLGVDGGGTKTAFALVGRGGEALAQHEEAGLYYPQIGLDSATKLLHEGIARVLALAGVEAQQVEFAFVGLPAYGEDSALTPELDMLPLHALPQGRFRCGNDVECGWAGSLSGEDGISVVAGTGSIAYGQFGGRSARAGGWGELFGDEGSAYWIAREGLALFSRMSDGRLARGPLYDIVRRALRLAHDLDLCAWVYGRGQGRSDLAQLAPLVGQAANAGDEQALLLLDEAASHLVSIVKATHDQLGFADGKPLRVSYSGGVLHKEPRALQAFQSKLQARLPEATLCRPAMPPVLGAVLLAARHAGRPLDGAALRKLGRAGRPPTRVEHP
jgi:N-acetylglucosamine kinase-like BadF-type ATPase